MFLPPTPEILKKTVETTLDNRIDQGHQINKEELFQKLDQHLDSYKELISFLSECEKSPIRDDWEYREPNDLEEIWKEAAADRKMDPVVSDVDLEKSSQRVEAAFYGSVCGCMLGKPIEVDPTLEELKKALEKSNQWPLNDYTTEEVIAVIGRRNNSWFHTVREKIAYVAPDDDINYSIMGMLLLREHGRDFSKRNIHQKWMGQIPTAWAWGPERLFLLKAGLDSLNPTRKKEDFPGIYEEWVNNLNPGNELCGAVIRADAYGYACPGHPALAAELAWRDASLTHRRTGIYSTMFVASAIAMALVSEPCKGNERLSIFETALQYIPQKSRFHHIVTDSIERVKNASHWMEAYESIHGKYKQYTHCQVYQEIGTLMNTLKFAENVGDGICIQVSQGNDTDSFGATAGSILGAFFGPGHLEERWLTPFNNRIHTTLANFHEQQLDQVAKMMGELPQQIMGNKEVTQNQAKKAQGKVISGDPLMEDV